MKNYICTLLFVVGIIGNGFAQDENTPRRPENIGISDFDLFKNNSFDILDESTQLRKSATRIDEEIKGFSGVLTSLTVDKLRGNYKALKEINQSSQSLTEKIGSMDEQGKQLLASAKNVNPKMKSPAATNSTNKSIKGLDAARKNLTATSALVQDNLKIIVNELKARGEVIEE